MDFEEEFCVRFRNCLGWLENEGGRVGDLNLHYVDLKARMSVERKKNLSLQPVCRYGVSGRSSSIGFFRLLLVFWRVGRVVDCGGLENRWGASLRGFESLTLRSKHWKSMFCTINTRFYTQECKVGCFYITGKWYPKKANHPHLCWLLFLLLFVELL